MTSFRKIWIVTSTEFSVAVKSKAFVIGVVMLPVLMGGGILVEKLTKDHADVSDRKLAVVDGTGAFVGPLAAMAEARNAKLFDASGKQREPRFLPERVVPVEGESPDALRLRLSDEVKAGRLFAFLEIPAAAASADPPPQLSYYSNTPTYRDLAQWVEVALNSEVRRIAVAETGLGKEIVAKLDRKLDVGALGLVERTATGETKAAKAVDPFRTVLLPMVVLFLLFMTVMSAAPQLLNAVMEEKQLRISEFLVSAVTSFELLAGKLLGTVGVAGLLGLIYMSGGLGMAGYFGVMDNIPFGLVPWFFAFLVLGTLIFGALFISIGAACTDLRDAQSMMGPAMMIVMLPMFVWPVMLKEPNGGLATVCSMIPLMAPILMPLRIAVPPGPPWWHPPVAFALTVGLASVFVFAAGRIFRVGILSQGKGATFREMLRWMRTK